MIYHELSKVECVSILLEDEYADWSREGAEYLVEMLEEMGTDIKFDRVALRCDWSEMTEKEIMSSYSRYDESFDVVIGDLRDRTTVHHLTNGRYMIETTCL